MLRTSISTLARRTSVSLPSTARTVVAAARPAAVLQQQQPQAARFYAKSAPLSGEWKDGSIISYDELKPITKNPSDDVVVIDVREPDEVALGSIPSSVNIPLSDFEKSLSLDEGDFTKKHGFHKPGKTQKIVFYCRSGKRSTTASDLARKAGFKGVRNYTGSWLEWSDKQKKEGENDD
ncbi:endoplasmic reticulum protein [Pseudohyphozyma bogoriensis]|nr:endoplasmic reticulum protein [Pseudohyphozyma bogoriensis]